MPLIMEKVRDLTPSVKGIEKIHLKTHNRHLSVDPEKILFCKAEGSYTRVVMEDNCPDILVTKPLKIFQKCIPEEVFLRCHYSYLINVNKVKSFDSKQKIIVFEGFHIPVSRRKAHLIFSILLDLGIHDIKNSDHL
jgi:two-component system, LytTR family, response regulator